jgi:hypothetical protein
MLLTEIMNIYDVVLYIVQTGRFKNKKVCVSLNIFQLQLDNQYFYNITHGDIILALNFWRTR